MFFDDPALQSLKRGFDAEKVKKEGIVRGTERGFGFLEVDGEEDSYFIPPQEMKSLIPGDRIVAVIIDAADNKKQAKPESLVESSLKDTFIARVVQEGSRLMVTPDIASIRQSFFADDYRKDKSVKLEEGDWLSCSLKKHALTDGSFRVSVRELVSKADAPTAPWVVGLRALNLPTEAPKEDAEYPFLEKDLPREDLSSIPFVTIDSEKTLDMDDALYIEKLEDGDYKLMVAIADPTGYISEESRLDKEASERAFSIYLPGLTIPMLPHKLSDDLCSLRENELRYALVGEIFVKKDGEVDCSRTAFKLATIKSHGKLIYNYVSDYIEHNDTSHFNPSEEIKAQLALLVEFTKLRDEYRSTKQASFRARPEYEFILTEEGALDHIEINYRRIANQIVEEAMIAANVACGEYLAEHLNTGIFNTHMGFDVDEVDNALELLEAFGFKTTEDEVMTINGFCAARRFANSQSETYLDNMLRKYQDYSQISINPAPHYALGVASYATWTSPIRKYGDMINHRLIKSLICEQEHPRMPDEELLTKMNYARRYNRMADRDLREHLYTTYLAEDFQKGTVFDAEIFDVVRGGLRVGLLENGASVFVPMSLFSAACADLDFNVNTGKVTCHGETVFKLGDSCKVRIANIDTFNCSIIATMASLPLNLPLANVEEVMQKRRTNLQNNRR